MAFAKRTDTGVKPDVQRREMGKESKDGMYFPLSDDWRRKETRIADCTARIERVMKLIKQEGNV